MSPRMTYSKKVLSLPHVCLVTSLATTSMRTSRSVPQTRVGFGVVVSVCRRGGTTNVMLCDLDMALPIVADRWKLEEVADGLPILGGLADGKSGRILNWWAAGIGPGWSSLLWRWAGDGLRRRGERVSTERWVSKTRKKRKTCEKKNIKKKKTEVSKRTLCLTPQLWSAVFCAEKFIKRRKKFKKITENDEGDEFCKFHTKVCHIRERD